MKTLRLLTMMGFVLVRSAAEQDPHRAKPLDDILRVLEWQSMWESDDLAFKVLLAKAPVDLLVFNARDGVQPRVGFCSKAIGLCRAYIDPYWTQGHVSMQLRVNESPDSALSRFFAEDLAKFLAYSPLGLGPSIPRTLASYEVAHKSLEAVNLSARYHSRRSRITKGVDFVALSRVLRCPCGASKRNNQLLVPYFDVLDPFVYVVRECLCQCQSCSRGIAVVRWRDGRWLFSARDLITDDALVRRITEKFVGKRTIRVDPN